MISHSFGGSLGRLGMEGNQIKSLTSTTGTTLAQLHKTKMIEDSRACVIKERNLHYDVRVTLFQEDGI